jgi:hypothetical protein
MVYDFLACTFLSGPLDSGAFEVYSRGGSVVQGHRVWVNVSVLAIIAVLGGKDESPLVEAIQNENSLRHFEFAEASPCASGTTRVPQNGKS